MAAEYPDAIASTIPATPDSGTPLATDHREAHTRLREEVVAIEAELGTNPSGGSADVAARFTAVEADVAALEAASGATIGTDPDGVLFVEGQAAHAGITATRTTTSAVSSFVAMPENIVKVGSTYWLLYSVATTPKTSLYLASSTSADGPWTSYGEVLTVGSLGWETTAHTNGGSLVQHGSTFYLFYSVDATSGAIGVATASSVTGPYTKNATPLLQVSTSGWDSLRVNEPDVRVAPDGTWVMAYMGEDEAFTKGTTEKVGIATATDPLGPWTKADANPVLGFGASGQWDEGGAADPSLFYENGVWWCLYSGLAAGGGRPWQLGLAYAHDPAGPWTKHPSNPILGPGAGGAFDSNSVWRGAIYEEGGVYHLPYGGIPASALASDAKAGSATITGLDSHTPASRIVTDATLEARLSGLDAAAPAGSYPDATGAASGKIPQTDGADGWTLIDTPSGGSGGGGSVPTAWTDYTPTWTGATTNPTLGTGGQIKGRYRRFGYNVEGRIELRVGTGATAGSGLYYLTPPPGCTPAAPITGVSYAVGSGWIYSGTTIAAATLAIDANNPTKFRAIHAGNPGNVWASSSLPLTTSGNLVTFTFSFETTESAFGTA